MPPEPQGMVTLMVMATGIRTGMITGTVKGTGTATATATATATTIAKPPMAEGAIFDLLTWMSPSWPIGAFAHSGGLEWAVEAGHVTSRVTCAAWLGDLLHHGPLHNDGVTFVHAWRAAVADEAGRLAELAELASASQTGFERRLEATAQGDAFRRIARSAGGCDAAGLLLARIGDAPLCYPVAAALQCGCSGVPLEAALTAFLHAAIANLVSASQRLVPLGQTDGQLVLRELRPAVLAMASRLAALPETDDPFLQMGGCTLLAELGCMAHETQYTRLFRT